MLISFTLVAALGVAVLTSLALTPLARRIAVKVRAVDVRTPKKIHRHDIPRLGGLAIAGAFYLALVVFACNIGEYHRQISQSPSCLLVLLASGALMLGLGIYDDLRGASAATKLAVQVPVAALTWVAGIRVGTIVGPSGQTLIVPAALSLAATVVWVVGVTNAINLMDGLDGLAAGLAMQTLAAVALCAQHLHEPMLAGLMIVMVGAVAGFLRYNFHPARIFMGDSGSLFLGYMIAAGSVWCSQRATTLMVAVLPMVMLALPLLDTTLAVLRRLKRGQRITAGDLEHIHHQVLTIGRSQTRSVLILYAVHFAFNALAVVLAFSGGSRTEWGALGAAALVATAFLGWLHASRPPRHLDVVAIRRRNLLVRRALFELEGSLLRCERADDLREAIRSFHETIHGEFGEQPAVVPTASAQANS